MHYGFHDSVKLNITASLSIGAECVKWMDLDVFCIKCIPLVDVSGAPAFGEPVHPLS
jgi:hypothetical protein